MTKPIGVDLVEARLRDLGQTVVNQTVSLFKGGVFALAAVLLLDIVSQSEGRLLRLALWTASFGVALTSYNAWLNASVTDFGESVGRVVIIIMQMMAELMLFVALTPRFADQAWRGWALIYGIFMVITALTMLAVHSNVGVAIDRDLLVKLNALHARDRQTGRILLAFAIVAFAFAAPVLLLPPASPWPARLSMVLAVLATLGSLRGLVGMHHERRAMERMLQEVLQTEQ